MNLPEPRALGPGGLGFKGKFKWASAKGSAAGLRV